MIELGLLNVRIFWAKVTPKIGREEYLLLILCWKLILGENGETIIGDFYEKELLLSKL